MSSGTENPDNLLEGAFDESEHLPLPPARARTHTNTRVCTAREAHAQERLHQ
jgi:hypothetical protein